MENNGEQYNTLKDFTLDNYISECQVDTYYCKP